MKSIHKAALALSPLVVLGVCAGPAQAADQGRVPEGAVWSQHYFPSSGGVELHADVLLPEKRKKGQKLPVILSVGPYFGHAGQMGPEGFKKTGPSARFNDLIEEGGALERGYALVMVDSRGFGGSTGCHDLAGPGEQADVKAAIGWAAKQPWSSGAVAMYGKSYDAITALVGNNTDHPALKATVAMEPIWEPTATSAPTACPGHHRPGRPAVHHHRHLAPDAGRLQALPQERRLGDEEPAVPGRDHERLPHGRPGLGLLGGA